MGMFISALCSSEVGWKQDGTRPNKCFGICKGNVTGSYSKLLSLVILALHILALIYVLIQIFRFSSPWAELPAIFPNIPGQTYFPLSQSTLSFKGQYHMHPPLSSSNSLQPSVWAPFFIVVSVYFLKRGWYGLVVKHVVCGVRQNWVLIVVLLPVLRGVTLGKSCHFSEPQFQHL